MKQLLPILLFSCLGLFLSSTQAQSNLPEGYLSTDYEFVDIDGNWHSLYEYLDQGKSIIIDFSAFTCSVCWNYHVSGALQSVYNTYGPEGSDEVMVFMFQAGVNQYPAQESILNGLRGISNVSSGDWVSTSPYPVVVSSLGGDYRIPGTPMIMTICPNRVTKFSRTISTIEHYRFIQENCKPPAADFDVAMVELNGDAKSCAGGEYLPQIKIQNLGTSPEAFSEATIKTYVNDEMVNTEQWTGELNTFGFTGITLEPITTPSDGESFDLRVEVEWAADEITENNTLHTTIELLPAINGNMRVEFVNSYDSTYYWYEIIDSEGEVIRRKSSIDDFLHTDPSIFVDEFSLATGCYQFRVFCEKDRFASIFRLRDSNHNLLTENPRYRRTWTYEDGIRYTNFTVFNETTTSTTDLATAIDLQIQPNPAHDQILVSYEWQTSQEVQINLVDLRGQRWSLSTAEVAAGQQSTRINLPQLAAGLYFLEVKGEQGQYLQKLLIQ